MDGVPAALIWFFMYGAPATVLVTGLLLWWRGSKPAHRLLAIPLMALGSIGLTAALLAFV